MDTSRHRITLVDLLVIISMIGVFTGLVIPALQPPRHGSGRRMQCASNLRQVGLGLNAFQTTKGWYPNAATFYEGDGQNGTKIPTKLSESSIYSAFNGQFGVGVNSTAVPRDYGAMHSWVVDVLPYIDSVELANAWNFDRAWCSPVPANGNTGNFLVASRAIGILFCPEDLTYAPGQGNLSYVVNLGFSRWVADTNLGYTALGSTQLSTTQGPDWTGKGLRDPIANIDIAAQTGVMFLGTSTGKFPWDRKTTPNSIVDGASQTILATENVNAGYSPRLPFGPRNAINWATPHPNVVGFIASDKVCPDGDCSALRANTQSDAPAWANAKPSSKSKYKLEGINGGFDLGLESELPYPNSYHKGGVNVLMCDGSMRFISDTIDGTVYAKLITPAGSTLPGGLRQSLVGDSEWP